MGQEIADHTCRTVESVIFYYLFLFDAAGLVGWVT